MSVGVQGSSRLQIQLFPAFFTKLDRPTRDCGFGQSTRTYAKPFSIESSQLTCKAWIQKPFWKAHQHVSHESWKSLNPTLKRTRRQTETRSKLILSPSGRRFRFPAKFPEFSKFSFPNFNGPKPLRMSVGQTENFS